MKAALEKVSFNTIIDWFDDRIVDFLRVYVSIYENDHYLQGQKVEDPIAGVWFPKHFAADTLDWNGQTWYFISPDTRNEFEKLHSISHSEGRT